MPAERRRRRRSPLKAPPPPLVVLLVDHSRDPASRDLLALHAAAYAVYQLALSYYATGAHLMLVALEDGTARVLCPPRSALDPGLAHAMFALCTPSAEPPARHGACALDAGLGVVLDMLRHDAPVLILALLAERPAKIGRDVEARLRRRPRFQLVTESLARSTPAEMAERVFKKTAVFLTPK